MGVWKVKEFNALCHDLGLDKACLYADSLSIRWSAARYHKQNIQQKINELNIETFPEKVADYTSQFNFEFDALMLTLNSMWDILGQLINECFIRPKIDANKMYFDDIFKCYWDSIPSELKPILTSIKGNALYQKIKAYANVSKHKYVIQGTNQIDFTKIPTTVSYEAEFEYRRGEWHKLTLDAAVKCCKFAGESVIQVGTKTQELVKK
jgi:hypothetical protein